MKTRNVLLAIFLLLLVNNIQAQFVTTGTATSSNLWTGGSVGVGYTTTPTFGTNKFMVNGNSQITGLLGLGVAPNSSYRLNVSGNALITGNGFIGTVPTSGATKFNINSGIANDSGLRLVNLPNTATVSTNNNGRLLGVDNLGKVILVNAPVVPNSWNLLGNAATTAATNFIGTTDPVDLVFRRNNLRAGLLSTSNTIFGVNAGTAITTGLENVFVGVDAGRSKNGNANTFVGVDAGGGGNVIASNSNTCIGNRAGLNTFGSNNIIIGAFTASNMGIGGGGSNNTIIGGSLAPNTNLNNNVIIGDGSGNQRLIIDNTGAATIPGLAGANTGLVLTADNTGRLSMITAPTGVASNIYSSDGTLGGSRTVNMNGNNLVFDTAATTSKIYIGTTPTIPTTGGYKLFVEGGVLTEKVRVALEGTPNWADYVFAEDYKLMPLKEVESFYTANKHLPNVPSSQELVNEGLDLGAMQAKQMEKIEELTLYIVEQNKAIEILKAQVNVLLEKK